MDHVTVGAQFHIGTIEIECDGAIRGVLGLLQEQKELDQAALARRVGAEQTGDVAKLKVGPWPAFEISQYEFSEHRQRIVLVVAIVTTPARRYFQAVRAVK